MAGIVDRMVRAAKLDPSLYEEVERDETSMGQAMTVVGISSLAAGLGAAGLGGIFGLIGGAVAALVGWFVWAFVAHFVGTRLLPEPDTRADLSQVLRATGFAAAPGVVRILGFIPVLGQVISFAVSLWMLAAFVVAVRQALNYTNTGRAVAVCVIGWVIQWVVFASFMVLGLGGLLVLAS